MGESDSRRRFSGDRVLNDIPCSNLERINNEIERILVRYLLALEANNCNHKMSIYIMFRVQFVIIILLVLYVGQCPYVSLVKIFVMAFENYFTLYLE